MVIGIVCGHVEAEMIMMMMIIIIIIIIMTKNIPQQSLGQWILRFGDVTSATSRVGLRLISLLCSHGNMLLRPCAMVSPRANLINGWNAVASMWCIRVAYTTVITSVALLYDIHQLDLRSLLPCADIGPYIGLLRIVFTWITKVDTYNNGRLGPRAAVWLRRSKSVSAGLACCVLGCTLALSVTTAPLKAEYAQVRRY